MSGPKSDGPICGLTSPDGPSERRRDDTFLTTKTAGLADDLADLIRGLEDELLLPALWLIRRTGLGAILELYEPDEDAREILEVRLLTQHRALYDFVKERMEEN